MCPKHVKKNIVFLDFSNHAGAQVPIVTPKMKNFWFARLARFARLSTRKWDFRRRSQPRKLAHRSQDDVSLNKLPQVIIFDIFRSFCFTFHSMRSLGSRLSAYFFPEVLYNHVAVAHSGKK